MQTTVGISGVMDSYAMNAVRVGVPNVAPDPISWIQRLDMSDDPSSDGDGHIVLDHYQVEPILAQFDPAVRTVAIMAPEQTGKSFCWRLPILYKVRWMPGTFWVVYESDEKAEDINRETLHPLIMSVPELAEMVNRRSVQNRRYQLSNGTILDFSGAGADITSKAKRDGVADEVDTWPMPNPGKRANLRNFRKRFRVAFAKGRGCLVMCSSPKGEDSIIGDEWLDSDRGRWHLRCLKCGGLTIGSHKHDVVQWERDESGDPVNDSIRICCPVCKREHVESEAPEMNRLGGYVREMPNRIDARGFQWGALASPRVFKWIDFARAAQAGGRSGDMDAQVLFDNSYRGIPFSPRSAVRGELDALKLHEGAPPADDTICGLLFSADTQAKGWYWTVCCVDLTRDLYLAGYGLADTAEDLAKAWDARYLGHLPVLGVIDEGGHRKDEVDAIIADRRGLFTYKGNSRIGVDWKVDNDNPRRILANPHQYRYRMLHRLYRAETADGYWIGFPRDGMTQEIYDMLSWRPNGKVKNGHRLENWEPADADNDHWFDCLKQTETLLDFAKERLPVGDWIRPADWMKARPRQRRRGRA